MKSFAIIVCLWLGACSGGDDSCAVTTDPVVGKILCGCGNVGGPGTEPADGCGPAELGRPALCIDRDQLCDCRAYICRTRDDGRCSCGIGSYESSSSHTYTTSDRCEPPASGTCCVSGSSCECGVTQCGSGETQVTSCDPEPTLDLLAPSLLQGGGTRVASCSS